MNSLAQLGDGDTEEQRERRCKADQEWKCQKQAGICDTYRKTYQ